MTERISKPLLLLCPGAWSLRHLLILPGGRKDISTSVAAGVPSALRAGRSGRGYVWLSGFEAIRCKDDDDLQTLVWGPVCGLSRDSPLVFGEAPLVRLAAKDLLAESLRPLIRGMAQRFGAGGFQTKVVVPDNCSQMWMSTMSAVVAIAGASSHTLHRAAEGVLKYHLEVAEPWIDKKIAFVVDVGFSGVRVTRFDSDESRGGWLLSGHRVLQLSGMEELFEQAWDEARKILIPISTNVAAIPEMRWHFSEMISGLDALGAKESGIPLRQWRIWAERAALDLSHRLRKAIQSEILADEANKDIIVLLSGGGLRDIELVKILCKEMPWTCTAVNDPAFAALRGHAEIPIGDARATAELADTTPEIRESPTPLQKSRPYKRNEAHAGTTSTNFSELEPAKVADSGEPVRKEKKGISFVYEFKGKDRDEKKWLIQIEPGDWPQSHRLVIGRSDDKSDVIVEHESISRTHAVLEKRGHHLYVADLGSSNGSWLNGSQLAQSDRPKVMMAGDTVCFGDISLRFSVKSP